MKSKARRYKKNDHIYVDETRVVVQKTRFPLQNWPYSVSYITAVYCDKILQPLP